MKVSLSPAAPADTTAGLLSIGLFDGAELPEWLAGAPGAADVRSGFKKLTIVRPNQPGRVLVVGLGPESDFDAERARVAASFGVRQAQTYQARLLAWQVPGDERIAAALVTGTILTGYRFDRLRSSRDEDDPGAGPEELVIYGAEGAEGIVEIARISAETAR